MDRDLGSLVKRAWRNQILKEPGGVDWREEYEMLMRKIKIELVWQQFGKENNNKKIEKTGKKR